MTKTPKVIPFGFEPKTYCLEGSCSIQLSYGTKITPEHEQLLYPPDSCRESYGTKYNKKGDDFNHPLEVGVAGFEPTTSCSQSRRDTGLRYTPKRGITIKKYYLEHYLNTSGIRAFDLPDYQVGTRYQATLHPEKRNYNT